MDKALISGEWSETPFNQGKVKFLISHSDDKRAWALLDVSFPNRIIAVAESSSPMTVEEVGALMLRQVQETGGPYFASLLMTTETSISTAYGPFIPLQSDLQDVSVGRYTSLCVMLCWTDRNKNLGAAPAQRIDRRWPQRSDVKHRVQVLSVWNAFVSQRWLRPTRLCARDSHKCQLWNAINATQTFEDNLGVAVQLGAGGRSVKPAQAGIDALPVIGVIRHSSRVAWSMQWPMPCALVVWPRRRPANRCPPGRGHLDREHWIEGTWIEIATNAGIEDIAPIANSNSWRLLHRQKCIAACL